MTSSRSCPQCHKVILADASFCDQCGCPLSSNGRSDKSATVTLLLCLFLGACGAHRFYVGKFKTGILMLLTAGGFGIWTLVDLVKIACCEFTDSNGKYLIFTQGKASSVKLTLLILGSIILAIFVYVILLVTLVFWLTGPIITTIQDQLSALRSGDLKKAYSYMASEATTSLSYQDFEKYVHEHAIMTNNTDASFSERKIENSEGYAKGTLESKDGNTTSIEYQLLKENGIWKVLAVRIGKAISPTGQISLNTYKNKTDNYTIDYPADWTEENKSVSSVLFSGPTGTPSYNSAITIQIIPNKEGGGIYSNAKEAIDDIKQQINDNTKEIHYIESGKTTLPSDPKYVHGEYFICTYVYKDQVVKKMQYMLSRDNEKFIYSWSYTTSAEQYDNDLAIAKAMYNSWKIK